jgi:DNA repair exonuclease SbcCD ATPase subunit
MTETEDRLNTLNIDALRKQQTHFALYVEPWREKIKKIVDYYNEVDTECRVIIKTSTEALPDAIHNDFKRDAGLPFDKQMQSAMELREAISRAEVELSDLLQNKSFVESLIKDGRLYRDRCERLSLRISELEKAAQAYRDAIAVSAVVDKKDALARRVLEERKEVFNQRFADVQWLIDIDLKPQLQKALDASIVKEIQ